LPTSSRAEFPRWSSSGPCIEIKDSLAAGGPQNYMNLPGGTGDYISTPSHTDFNVLDDLCVIARILVPAAAPAAMT
jgi:hypothetical protein